MDADTHTPAEPLAKTFDPASIEARWYAHWENEGLFRPARPDAVPFTIVNPPPNVTGSLHIGHALDNTLQDVIVRYERLKGKDALWVVGTDHAGIATQMVVERNLASQGVRRTDLGRDAFIAKVWEWKAESGGAITRQLRRLGCSMDWANERFTMDEGFSRAVAKVFVDLFARGLVYRDKRLVNWDVKLGTAISDLEVETREVQGKFWHLTYPLADGSGSVSVATTRPETMLADMAVAVNPGDARYAALVGRMLRLPITGREIPIVADEHANPELGSGAVKITPGHDFNDFEVGRRAGFKPAEMLNMLGADGTIAQVADGLIPPALVGLDRFEARARVLELLEAEGALERVEDRVIQTPYGDRSGVVIEPWLTDQWYVDAGTLARPAIEAVRSGAVEIVPKSWEKTFFNWMENIQPWCVSRQLWWGHRIPVWYGPKRHDDGGISFTNDNSQLVPFVAESEEAVIELARAYYDCDLPISVTDDAEALRSQAEMHLTMLRMGMEPEVEILLLRDPDVLDTWFSSALWPFGTLGWPEDAGMVARHYPNDLLISGFDILFFWDARMLMQGIEFLGEAPWKRLYLHGLVRAADGQKMSKSKGNVVDPLGLIDRYGADALRFFMCAMESQGRDVKMDEPRVEGYRNFATKLWNAARFAQANGIGASASLAAPTATLAVNRWIIGELADTLATMEQAFADLRFDAAANAIYHFVWDRFCDWYLELIKPAFVDGEKGEIDAESTSVAGWVLDQILVMLHPFMPFITEELWHAMGPREYELIVAQWPKVAATGGAFGANQTARAIEIIQDIRAMRAAQSITPKTRLYAAYFESKPEDIATLTEFVQPISKMCNLLFGKLEVSDAVSFEATGSIEPLEGDPSQDLTLLRVTSRSLTLVAQLDRGFSDILAERDALTRKLESATKERDALARRLDNPAFVEKAKPEAIAKARADHADKAAEADRLAAALARLG